MCVYGDVNYAWPTAEIAVMGAEVCVCVNSGSWLGRSECQGGYMTIYPPPPNRVLLLSCTNIRLQQVNSVCANM